MAELRFLTQVSCEVMNIFHLAKSLPKCFKLEVENVKRSYKKCTNSFFRADLTVVSSQKLPAKETNDA